MEIQPSPVDVLVRPRRKCPSKKLRDLRRSYTFIQNKVKSEYDLLQKENKKQHSKINTLKVELKEKDELIQLNDGKIALMELEIKNLKLKLKQYSTYLKNSVTQNDKLKESIDDKNKEIVKLKEDLSIAKIKVSKLEIDSYLMKQSECYK